MDIIEMLDGSRDKELEDMMLLMNSSAPEAVQVKNEVPASNKDVNNSEVKGKKMSSPVVMVEKISRKGLNQAVFMEVESSQEKIISKQEASQKLEAFDPDYEQSVSTINYQQLKEILEEAKVSVEKAQDCAIKISQDENSDSNSCAVHFAQVVSSIDQAVISTTIGLTALESILSGREVEEEYKTELKEEFQEYEDEATELDAYDGDQIMSTVPIKGDDSENEDEMIHDTTYEPDTEEGSKDGIYYCNLCEYSTPIARYLTNHISYTHDSRKYECEECGYLAHRPYQMKHHLMKKHDKQEVLYVCDRENPEVKHYFCQLCSFSNKKQELLEKHIDSCHNAKETNEEEMDTEEAEAMKLGKEWSCERCTYTTKNKMYFDDHVNGIYKFSKCPWCELHFESKSRKFGMHLRNDHGVGTVEEDGKEAYKCPDCFQKFNQRHKIVDHMRAVHKVGALFHCWDCDYDGFSKKNLLNHLEEHNETLIDCPHCSQKYKSKFRLQKHIFRCHGQGVLCEDCGSTIMDKHNLNIHKKTCNGELRMRSKNGFTRPPASKVAKAAGRGPRSQSHIKCSQCDFTATGVYDLRKHYADKHKEPGSEKEIEQKCDLCDHVSTNVNNMRYHYYMEHKEKTYECDKCNFETTTKGRLKRHKEELHPEGSVTCEFCSLVCRSGISLQRHIKRKHSAKPQPKLRCKEPGCDYTAMTPSTIKQHIENVHLGITWPCNLCNYVGPYKGKLFKHMKTVHNVFPEGCAHKCDLCNFTTLKASTLVAHRKKVHNIECS